MDKAKSAKQFVVIEKNLQLVRNGGTFRKIALLRRFMHVDSGKSSYRW